METQNQISLSVAHRVEDGHATLEEKQEILEGKNIILQGKYKEFTTWLPNL